MHKPKNIIKRKIQKRHQKSQERDNTEKILSNEHGKYFDGKQKNP
jgi:hypothetical protein